MHMHEHGLVQQNIEGLSHPHTPASKACGQPKDPLRTHEDDFGLQWIQADMLRFTLRPAISMIALGLQLPRTVVNFYNADFLLNTIMNFLITQLHFLTI